MAPMRSTLAGDSIISDGGLASHGRCSSSGGTTTGGSAACWPGGGPGGDELVMMLDPSPAGAPSPRRREEGH